jgi:hypothetical protein
VRKPSSPKRQTKPESGRSGWYTYYAGYPSQFVRDVLTSFALEPASVVLDPWLGSGTTSAVSHECGLKAVGYDINPVMVLVSKARLLGSEVSPSEVALCQQIVEISQGVIVDEPNDPLCRWFGTEAASCLRSLEVATYSLLVGTRDQPSLRADSSLRSVSSLAAFFYVALFRTARELLQPFRSSNPTWLRIDIAATDRLNPSRQHVVALFWKHVTIMAAAQFQLLPDLANAVSEPAAPAEIVLGNSTCLPDSDGSVRLTIGSPPYCTRIDYAMATYPELSLLNYDDVAIDQLRRTMMGTTTVEAQEPAADPLWGRRCTKLLSTIYRHPSYASRSYYYKNFVQYFRGLNQSLNEIDRVSRSGSGAVLVVQDSNYKDVHIDLPKIVTEMLQAMGWESLHKFNYPSARHLGRIHGKAGEAITATESALVFSKPT